LDTSYSSVKVTDKAAVKTMANGQQGTPAINFTGNEDLGGGLKAYFRYEANFDGSDGANGLGAAGEVFVGLQGGFGSIQLGRANTHTLAAQGARTPFGTKVGSGYNSVNGTAFTRNADSIKYTSPAFSGITVGFSHALKVAKVDAVKAAELVANGSAPTKAVVLGSPEVAEKAAWNEIGVFYSAGPVKVAFTNVQQKNTVTQNNLSVQYNLGFANVMAGMHNEDDKKNAATSKKKGSNIAVSVPMGNTTLMANMGTLDVAGGRTDDRKITAVGARYDLSKRTNVYARYVTEKQNKATSAADVTTKTTLLGLQHSF
jgi:predicted porin